MTIPDDLLAAGWYWSGSLLCNRIDGLRTISIGFPPPRCYDAAREMMAKRAELAAAPKKKVKIGKRTLTLPDVPTVVEPEPELAAEQLEMAL